MSDLRQELSNLREKVRQCSECIRDGNKGIINLIAEGHEHAPTGVGYWSDAFPHYDAKLMIVGQDWGNVDYLNKFVEANKGIPEPERYDEKKNPTWENLMRYIHVSEIDTNDVYLTNAVACLRKGKMSSSKDFDPHWIANCLKLLLDDQVRLIKPKVIAGIGKNVFTALVKHFRFELNVQDNYGKLVDEYKPEQYRTETGAILFPLFHSGYYGVLNRGGRNIEKGHSKMIEDFKKLKGLIESN